MIDFCQLQDEEMNLKIAPFDVEKNVQSGGNCSRRKNTNQCQRKQERKTQQMANN